MVNIITGVDLSLEGLFIPLGIEVALRGVRWLLLECGLGFIEGISNFPAGIFGKSAPTTQLSKESIS